MKRKIKQHDIKAEYQLHGKAFTHLPPFAAESNYDGYDGQALACPECGCEELHPAYVDVWMHDEDEHKPGVRVDGESPHGTPIADRNNPSPRRQGILVRFWCEQCDCEPALRLVQHKGPTFLHWTRSR